MAMLSCFRAGDRIALYTTPCHQSGLTNTTPRRVCGLQPVLRQSLDNLRRLLPDVLQRSPPDLQSAHPNSPISDAIRAVMVDLKPREPKPGRTHMFLVSPSLHDLHDVSIFEPELYIDHINPAVLLFGRLDEAGICNQSCCYNITAHNLTHFEPVFERIGHIVRCARSRPSTGVLHDVQMDIRGPNVVRIEGSTTAEVLRLGEIHSFSVQVKDCSKESYQRRFHRAMRTADPSTPFQTGNQLLADVTPEHRAEAKHLLDAMGRERKIHEAALNIESKDSMSL